MATENVLWNVISECQNTVGKGNFDEELLCTEFEKRISDLSESELVQLEKAYIASMQALDNIELFKVSFLVSGGGSDDAFLELRYRIVLCGQKAFNAAIADPFSICESDSELRGIFFSGKCLDRIIEDVYTKKTGRSLPFIPVEFSHFKVEPDSLIRELKEKHPVLFRKFWGD